MRTLGLAIGAILLTIASSTSLGQQTQPAGAAATDWPQWRGPTRDGIAPAGPKLLDSWPKDGPKLVWKSEFIPASEDGGCGSVVVADGKAYVYVNWAAPVALTTKMLEHNGWQEGVPEDLAQKVEEGRTSPARAKLKTASEIETYLNAFTAKLDPQQAEKYADFIKKRVVNQAGYGSFAWSTLEKWAKLRDKDFPTIDGLAKEMGLLVWHYKTGILDEGWPDRTCRDTVVCLDGATGKTLWKKDFPGDFKGNINMGRYPASSTPAVVGGRCYVAGSAGLYCLSAKDGAVVWQTPIKFTNSSPLVADDAVYVKLNARFGGLAAYDAATGRKRWCCDVGGGGNFECFNIVQSPVEWKSDGASYILCPSMSGLYCVDAATGKVVWRELSGAICEGGSTPALDGDTLVLDCDSDIKAFKLTPQKAELLWATKPGNHRAGSPICHHGLVYATGNGLRCLDAKTGEVKWNATEVSTNYGSPIWADGKIVCPTGGRDFLYMLLLKATPEKYEVVGSFGKSPDERHIVGCCTSPGLADGKLYLRLKDAVGCYDLTDAGAK